MPQPIAVRSVHEEFDEQVMLGCVHKLLGRSDAAIESWTCATIDYRTPNFVNGGLFRLHGTATVDRSFVPWSLIVKITKPDADRAAGTHYNYWKREAFAYRSDLRGILPEGIAVPDCYAVEEKPDGRLWLWLQEIPGNTDSVWSDDEYGYAAWQIGRFHAAYLNGLPIPEEDWLCRSWLRSWVAECSKYTVNVRKADWHHGSADERRIRSVLDRYEDLLLHMPHLIDGVERLPRVLAHQDIWRKNMYIRQEPNRDMRLVLIDWQFASVSGVGEELGRFYGLTMSKRYIRPERYAEYDRLLFGQYTDGLTGSGWGGDVRLARYGFCTAVAARSIWEVPKMIELLAASRASDGAEREAQEERARLLLSITEVHMQLLEEAKRLHKELGGMPN